MRTSWNILVLCLLAAAVGGGCSSKGNSEIAKMNDWIRSSVGDVPPAEYVVQPPDVLTITAPHVKELDGRTVAVRTDGKITFNLVGEVLAAGRTTDEIADDLTRRLARFYDARTLDVAVRVQDYKSQFVYVFGQVDAPGVKPYTGSDSVLKVLADAKLNDDAWAERVVVVRPHEDPNVRQKITIDLKKMYASGDVRSNILLENGDVIYVPPTPLAHISRTFTRMLIPLRPLEHAALIAGGGI